MDRKKLSYDPPERGLRFLGFSRRFLFVAISATIAGLMVDTMLNYVIDFVHKEFASNLGIFLFVAIVALSWFGQYVILEFVRQKTKLIRRKSIYLNGIHTAIIIVQCILAGVTALTILQIVLLGGYFTFYLTVVTGISLTTNFLLMFLFAERFFSWYRSNRNSIVVLLYGLTFAVIGITSVSAAILDTVSLIGKQREEPKVTSASEISYPPSSEPGSIKYMIGDIYHYSDLVSFVLVWVSSALLLRQYSRKVGKIKLWIIVSIPLVYYLSAILEAFNLYQPSSDNEQFYYYLYSSLNTAAGGILFGIAFRTVATSLRSDSLVRDYMTISAYGFTLLFISNQITLVATSYPPSGLPTISFMGLSAYLLLVGLYSSAVSLSEDTRLRQYIRKNTIEQTKLLGNIGVAQMHDEIEKKVLKIARGQQEELTAQTGIEMSFGEEEMKEYLETVLEEIKKK